MNRTVVIVAGGSGNRMKSDTPKQFLLIDSQPIVQISIKKFYKFDPKFIFYVVLPEAHIDYWKQLCINHDFKIEHEIVAGGEERFYSVQNALKQIGTDGITAVHDAVRPLVSIETIEKCVNTCEQKGNAIPYVDVADSVRIIKGNTSQATNRSMVKLIQTPQVFLTSVLKDAYMQTYNERFTDDSTVVENLGYKLNLVHGNTENIKITNKNDLIIAEALFKCYGYYS